MAMAMLAAALFLPGKYEEQGKRIHQHLTARAEEGCSCQGSLLCTHLPLVVIDTGGQEIPGKPLEERDWFGQARYSLSKDGSPAITDRISVMDKEGENNHPSDTPDIATACQIRIRGNSSRRFPKLSYSLRLLDQEGDNQKLSVMGMGAHHEWVLYGPMLDKTLVRNYMWYNIAGEIMGYAPHVRFCEVMLDGQYQGLYLMTENITNGGGRLHLNMNIKGAEGVGYLLRCDRPTQDERGSLRNIYTYSERVSQTKQNISIRYPGEGTLTQEMAKNIELDYSAFEKALFSYDYNTKDYGYWHWIDVGNFIDYFLINEFTKNLDAGSYSTYIYKELGEKYRLCVWDFNNSCDNYQEQASGLEGFSMAERAWYFMLMKDGEFVERLLGRYRELRQGVLAEEYLMEYIDGTLAYLGPAVERNSRRWDMGWEGLSPTGRNPGSHQEAVGQMKEWLKGRGRWLDENIHTLRHYAHPSRDRKSVV